MHKVHLQQDQKVHRRKSSKLSGKVLKVQGISVHSKVLQEYYTIALEKL